MRVAQVALGLLGPRFCTRKPRVRKRKLRETCGSSEMVVIAVAAVCAARAVQAGASPSVSHANTANEAATSAHRTGSGRAPEPSMATISPSTTADCTVSAMYSLNDVRGKCIRNGKTSEHSEPTKKSVHVARERPPVAPVLSIRMMIGE